jgi:hypothetical protein
MNPLRASAFLISDASKVNVLKDTSNVAISSTRYTERDDEKENVASCFLRSLMDDRKQLVPVV